MSSSDLNLNSVGFQNQLRSKPVRENFTDIENNFNALRAEVYASIASTASFSASIRACFSRCLSTSVIAVLASRSVKSKTP